MNPAVRAAHFFLFLLLTLDVGARLAGSLGPWFLYIPGPTVYLLWVVYAVIVYWAYLGVPSQTQPRAGD